MKWKNSLITIGLTIFTLLASSTTFAENKTVSDASVKQTLDQFYAYNVKNKEIAEKAVGMLIFPKITKAGVGIAGEFGEGVLQVKGANMGYYKIESASVGLTLGIASRSEIIMFMTQKSLDEFKKSDGWKVGVDAGIAIATIGGGGQYDSKTLQEPILGFVFGENGLIGDLSLEGSKITKIQK
jgi:lipid-binding SYLF domain-containing protein